MHSLQLALAMEEKGPGPCGSGSRERLTTGPGPSNHCPGAACLWPRTSLTMVRVLAASRLGPRRTGRATRRWANETKHQSAHVWIPEAEEPAERPRALARKPFRRALLCPRRCMQQPCIIFAWSRSIVGAAASGCCRGAGPDWWANGLLLESRPNNHGR